MEKKKFTFVPTMGLHEMGEKFQLKKYSLDYMGFFKTMIKTQVLVVTVFL